ncbi:MAG: metal-dependent hydrolase [Chloroflexi bacterium]|nr:metal-dependent hydrolase [Chloroflexota bacterium]
MAQAGIHAMVGMLTRKVADKRRWLLFGAILGSFIPDMDNFGVAVATLTKAPTEGIHRTATHSIFFMLAVVAVFYLLGQVKKDVRWSNLGFGLGLGLLLHSLLDILVWFNGVALFWPLPIWVNLWENITPPAWFMKFMDPAEFLCFGIYLWILGGWAHGRGTDADFMGKHRIWMMLEFALFIIFTPLAYLMTKGFLTIYGALYLFSITMAFFVTIRMRRTVEAVES